MQCNARNSFASCGWPSCTFLHPQNFFYFDKYYVRKFFVVHGWYFHIIPTSFYFFLSFWRALNFLHGCYSCIFFKTKTCILSVRNDHITLKIFLVFTLAFIPFACPQKIPWYIVCSVGYATLLAKTTYRWEIFPRRCSFWLMSHEAVLIPEIRRGYWKLSTFSRHLGSALPSSPSFLSCRLGRLRNMAEKCCQLFQP